jgi:Ni,Fe-hydrogenase maturation factor
MVILGVILEFTAFVSPGIGIWGIVSNGSKLGGLSLRVNGNKTVEQILHGQGGLVQRLVKEGNLTSVDLANFNRAYGKLKEVSQTPGTEKYSAFNPNSSAMAEVLHYLFLCGNRDIIAAAIELINRIASELTSETSERIFEECSPCIKTNDQSTYFLQVLSRNPNIELIYNAFTG